MLNPLSVWVGSVGSGLDPAAQKENLVRIFSEWGGVAKVVYSDKGYAFVNFEHSSSVTALLAHLKAGNRPPVMHGRSVVVKPAQWKGPGPPPAETAPSAPASGAASPTATPSSA